MKNRLTNRLHGKERTMVRRGSSRGVPQLPLVAALMVLAASPGCDRSASSDAPVAHTAAAIRSPEKPAPKDPPGQGVSNSERRFVGNIPYDVFFEDPLAVASEVGGGGPAVASTEVRLPQTPGALPPASSSPHPSDDSSGSRSENQRSATSAVPWQELADIGVLEDEVKQIRNRLNANLLTVAAFNQNLDAIHNDAIILALIAAVVSEYPDTLSWQRKAGFIRDRAVELAGHSDRTGREAWAGAREVFEQLVVALDGGTVADDSPMVEFVAIAPRSDVMKRIERSFDWLKSEIGSEDRFRRSREDVIRESSLLAVLGTIVGTEGYDWADEPRYQQFVKALTDGSVAMTAAVRGDQFPGFLAGRDRVQNACAGCHGEYAFGKDGL